MSGKVGQAEVDNSISTHAEAIDPHGDRAYTDSAIAALNLYYKGTYASVEDLRLAYPTSSAGNWAIVDQGSGLVAVTYLWDATDSDWVSGSEMSAGTTDALPEGTTNLYFTDSRAQVAVIGGVTGLLKANLGGVLVQAEEGVDYIAPENLRTIVNEHVTSSWTVPETEITPYGKFIVTVGSNAACECVLEPPATLNVSPGDKVSIMQGQTGALTIVSLLGSIFKGNTAFTTQYEVKTAIALDADTWLIVGAQ